MLCSLKIYNLSSIQIINEYETWSLTQMQENKVKGVSSLGLVGKYLNLRQRERERERHAVEQLYNKKTSRFALFPIYYQSNGT